VRKVFVDVIAKHTSEGHIIPLSVMWKDGRQFDVDRVIDVRKAASLKVGGCGWRYTCRIQGKETFLFLDNDKWFVESREA
jgi:hypothetical protein